MTKKIFISFNVMTDESLRFSCKKESGNQISATAQEAHGNRKVSAQSFPKPDTAVKEIFRIDNYYFFYVFNRSNGKNTYSLREITEKEYNLRREEILQQRPAPGTSKWRDKQCSYSVYHFYNREWQRSIPAGDCIFITKDNPIKDVCDAVTSEALIRDKQENEQLKAEKREYAKQCGGLAHRLGIEFINVLQLKPIKGKLMKFKESYERAIQKCSKMSLSEQKQMYKNLFLEGRDKRKKAMDALEINYFEADVSRLNLKELEELLLNNLSKYEKESATQALQNAINADYDTRARLYEALMKGNSTAKQSALQELGVNVDAIILKKYPLSEIKRALASTLGYETER